MFKIVSKWFKIVLITRNIIIGLIDYVRTKPSSRIIKTYGEYVHKKIGGIKFKEIDNKFNKDTYTTPFFKAIMKIEKPESDRIIEEANYESKEATTKYHKKINGLITLMYIIANYILRKKISSGLMAINYLYHFVVENHIREQHLLTAISVDNVLSKLMMVLLSFVQSNNISPIDEYSVVLETLILTVDFLI